MLRLAFHAQVRRTFRQMVSLLPVLALVLGLLAGCSSQSTTQVPRFEPGACVSKLGFGVIAGTNAECGYLIVREDRVNPSSRSIKIAIVILKSESQSPDPDPVIYLAGGPGESALTDIVPSFTGQSLGYLLRNRDIVFFDPRGTGYSQPTLDCPELRDAEYGALDQNLAPAQLVALDRTALTQCYTRLTGAGINPSLYNTAAVVADIHNLIQALGYQLYNLEGGSYGTRLGLQFMRDKPLGLRSVILDAVFPPQLTFFTMIPPGVMASFDTLFRACAADATCTAKYPHLEAMLYSLIAQLDAHPVSFDVQDPFTHKNYTVLLNGTRLVPLLTLSLYQSDLLGRIPLAISSALGGNTEELREFFNAVWFGEDAISRGMWYATECSEDAPFITPADVDTAEQALTPPLRAGDPFTMRGRLSVCDFWKVKPALAVVKQAVVVSTPTLLMEGEFDPVTPPSNGQLAASTLANGTYLLFPGLGHGSMYTGPCPLQVALGFLDTGNKPADTSCIAQMGEPAFA